MYGFNYFLNLNAIESLYLLFYKNNSNSGRTNLTIAILLAHGSNAATASKCPYLSLLFHTRRRDIEIKHDYGTNSASPTQRM